MIFWNSVLKYIFYLISLKGPVGRLAAKVAEPALSGPAAVRGADRGREPRPEKRTDLVQDARADRTPAGGGRDRRQTEHPGRETLVRAAAARRVRALSVPAVRFHPAGRAREPSRRCERRNTRRTAAGGGPGAGGGHRSDLGRQPSRTAVP